MEDMRKIYIFDTTLRDGEQVPGATLRPQEKLRIARQLEKLGVDVVEAGFPISSPGDFEAVSLIAKDLERPVVAALARCNEEDIMAAWEALKGARRPRIHVFLPASDIHLEKKIRKTREEAKELAVKCVKFARSLVDDVEYSPEDATRSDFGYLVEVIRAVVDAGATVVNIPDTVGYSIPDEFGEMIRRLREEIPELGRKVMLSVHCHNDLGLATANSLAAVKNGADQVECTINGIGERAGNAALEEVVMAIRTRRDLFGDVYTEIESKEIARTSRLVSGLMGIPVQPNKAIVGANAFAHSSGIHQDGILKDRRTYEIIRPEDVGAERHEIILTARSGRHGLLESLRSLGYSDISEEAIERIYRRFLEIADHKKVVLSEDLEAIISDEMMTPKEIWKLERIQVVTGSNITPTAMVKLSREGEEVEEAAVGDGPVDAVYRAILRIVGIDAKLVDYSIRAASPGTEAVGEVRVAVEYDDGSKRASGRASGTDIIEASARAFIMAINKLME
jgi:2-isopropylmalate synthase